MTIINTQKEALTSVAITKLDGVGVAVANKLAKLHLHTLVDLLLHLPLRYEDRTQICPLSSLQPGQQVLVEAPIQSSQVSFAGRRSLHVLVAQQHALLNLRFMHFSAHQANSFMVGKTIRCYGDVRLGRNGLEMIHPEYRLFNDIPPPLEQHLTPVYHTTEGISQTRMRLLIKQAWQYLDTAKMILPELLPSEFITQHQLPDVVTALRQLHYPPKTADVSFALTNQEQTPAYKRLIIEELLAHHLCLIETKKKLKQAPAMALVNTSQTADKLIQSLPFTLTKAQQKAWQEIATNTCQTQPMTRMLQGDVGSGKTIVAALAVCQGVDSGTQVVVLAPTEILASQHLANFSQWLKPMGIHITWLASKQSAKERKIALEQIKSGVAQIIIGTHAVFQEQVDYARLGLVIVDEQHRFGVAQRQALLNKAFAGSQPHQLIMSATPIPRTLAMSIYGDLDHSIIDELPPQRKPINTRIINNQKRQQIIQRIANVCQQGTQVYWICPLIETSEVLNCQAAEDTYAHLVTVLPKLTIGLVHGRMSSTDKANVMHAFKAGTINLLVATTVIEVGVDVPNANLMLIENAERLGLAQLHQLRGRVGRGQADSHCILMYQAPLKAMAQKRLNIIRQSQDGFAIAEQDLKLRGPGEVLGTRQAGAISLRIADLIRDGDYLPIIHHLANKYPQKNDKSQLLIDRWLNSRQAYALV